MAQESVRKGLEAKKGVTSKEHNYHKPSKIMISKGKGCSHHWQGRGVIASGRDPGLSSQKAPSKDRKDRKEKGGLNTFMYQLGGKKGIR